MKPLDRDYNRSDDIDRHLARRRVGNAHGSNPSGATISAALYMLKFTRIASIRIAKIEGTRSMWNDSIDLGMLDRIQPSYQIIHLTET